jgi:hypothetical protein
VNRASWRGLLLLVAACSEFPINPREVPGTYVMNRGRAADTLMLQQDEHRRLYRRVYRMPGQPLVIDSGTWSVDRSRRPMVVRLTTIWPRWRAETEASTLRRSPLTPVIWSAEPTRTLSGRIRLWVDEDLDWAYVRRR